MSESRVRRVTPTHYDKPEISSHPSPPKHVNMLMQLVTVLVILLLRRNSQLGESLGSLMQREALFPSSLEEPLQLTRQQQLQLFSWALRHYTTLKLHIHQHQENPCYIANPFIIDWINPFLSPGMISSKQIAVWVSQWRRV
jgi:hypothetical protein